MKRSRKVGVQILLLMVSICIVFNLSIVLGFGSEQKTTISFMRWSIAEQPWAAYQKAIEKFEKEHPGVKVKADSSTPYGQYSDKMLRIALAGEAPDVFVTYDAMFGPFVSMGVCSPLDEYIAETPDFKENFYETQWKIGIVGGEQYGIPYRNGGHLLYYNKEMFQEAGLPEDGPQTYEQLIQAAKACTRDTNNDGKIDQFGFGEYWADDAGIHTFRVFLLSRGGYLLNEDESPAFNGPVGQETLQFLVDLDRKHKVVPPGPVQKEKMMVRNEFSNGLISMFTDGPWFVGYMASGGSKVKYGIVEVPHVGEIWGTACGYVLHSMSSQTKHPELAWDLMKEFLSAEFISDYCKASALIPPRKDVVESGDPYWQAEYMPLFVRVLNRPNSRQLPAVARINELLKIVKIAIQKAALGEKTVKEALDEAAEIWEQIR